MADHRISHVRFQKKNLAVRPAAWFGPKLILDGREQSRAKGAYAVTDDAGRSAVVKLRGGFDPIPDVDLDGEKIRIVPPLPWYEYALAAWPIGLVAVGGAVGGGLGAGAATVNLRIMRADKPLLQRYVLVVAVGLVAVGLYVVIAGGLGLLMRG